MQAALAFLCLSRLCGALMLVNAPQRRGEAEIFEMGLMVSSHSVGQKCPIYVQRHSCRCRRCHKSPPGMCDTSDRLPLPCFQPLTRIKP
ncbi:MAG: hypothetical protein ACI8T1_004185 [Verrucomicrobiales bacterium]|jgi:hypothetical protein